MKKLKTLSKFVDTCCLVAENAHYPAVELYLTYVNWCINRGAAVHDQFSFLDEMEDQGFPHFQQKAGCYFHGISVLPNYRVE